MIANSTTLALNFLVSQFWDSENVIFNFSKYVLSDCEKSHLTKGLNFSTPCKKLDDADYLVQFKLSFRDIRNLDILANEDLDFVKAKIKEAELSSYRSYNKYRNLTID